MKTEQTADMKIIIRTLYKVDEITKDLMKRIRGHKAGIVWVRMDGYDGKVSLCTMGALKDLCDHLDGLISENAELKNQLAEAKIGA